MCVLIIITKQGILMNKSLVVNLLGGPGIGKSSIAASIFAESKKRGFNSELAFEYAKDLVWENNQDALSNQLYVFGHQHYRIFRLLDKVDYIITDSPFILSVIYDKEKRFNFEQLVVQEFKKLKTLNIILERKTEYKKEGRYHTEEESKTIDSEIKTLFDEYGIKYHICDLDNALEFVLEIMEEHSASKIAC